MLQQAKRDLDNERIIQNSKINGLEKDKMNLQQSDYEKSTQIEEYLKQARQIEKANKQLKRTLKETEDENARLNKAKY